MWNPKTTINIIDFLGQNGKNEAGIIMWIININQ